MSINEYLASLNEAQTAVAALRRDAAIVGVPGAGKTRALVALYIRLIQEGVQPSEILAITFTKAAANEMTKRVKALLGIKDAAISTIHSLARRLVIEGQPELITGGEFDDWNQMDLEVKYILDGWKREKRLHRGASYDLENVRMFISMCKQWGAIKVSGDPFGLGSALSGVLIEVMDIFDASNWTGLSDQMLWELVHTHERKRAERGLFNFDDMQMWGWMALLDASFRNSIRKQFKYVLMDESQDSNPIQWDIARLLTGHDSCLLRGAQKTSDGLAVIRVDDSCKHIVPEPQLEDPQRAKLLVFGDSSQCHPPGTLIWRRSDGKQRTPIEDLHDGDTVAPWGRSSQRVSGPRRVRVGVRKYKGPMLRVTAASREVEATPNHRFIARWTDAAYVRSAVYVMYREGLGYRVGWCQLFTKNKTCHLAQRARLEKADAVWILKTFDNKGDASIYESTVAAKYGLSQVVFEPNAEAVYYTRERIEEHFAAVGLGVDGVGALRCLKDHGLQHHLQFYPWPSRKTRGNGGKFQKATYMEVYAANLMPGLMAIPRPEGVNNWAPIDALTSRDYDGPVYSLDVEEHHSYVANGLVTLNSIYGWRGAVPEHFVTFAQRPDIELVQLATNYRSTPGICKAATLLVQGKPWHLAGEIAAAQKHVTAAATPPVLRRYDDPERESAETLAQIASAVADGDLRWKDCAVLGRVGTSLDLMEIACIQQRIPYRKLGGSSSFLNSKEVKDILAYLYVAAGLDGDYKHLRRAMNSPFRFIGKKILDRAESAAARNKTHMLDELSYLAVNRRGMSPQQAGAIRTFIALLVDLSKIAARAESLAQQAAGAKVEDPMGLDADGYTPGPTKMLVEVLSRTRYVQKLKQEEGVGAEGKKEASLIELQRIARRFRSPIQFLRYIGELRMTAKRSRKSKTTDKDVLTLATIHSAKGLEWKRVHVIDVSDGRLPHPNNPQQDEELRLLFVAVTRAMQTCVVSFTEPSVYIQKLFNNIKTFCETYKIIGDAPASEEVEQDSDNEDDRSINDEPGIREVLDAAAASVAARCA